jgi:hypothetical protein
MAALSIAPNLDAGARSVQDAIVGDRRVEIAF